MLQEDCREDALEASGAPEPAVLAQLLMRCNLGFLQWEKMGNTSRWGEGAPPFRGVGEIPSQPQKGPGLGTTWKALPAPAMGSMKNPPGNSWCSGRGWVLESNRPRLNGMI